MKMCSIAGRDKEDKRIKDLCDIVALSLYSGISLEKLKERLSTILNNKKLAANLSIIGKADIEKASQLLKIDAAIISNLLARFA